MNVPLPSPSAEPMLYFLSNSLAVVGVAAAIFFVLGLWFGFLTWGRYKRRSRAFQEETSLLRHEIATLKRRIAEEAVEPSRPVSIIDEGPAVELQPLLFQMASQLSAAVGVEPPKESDHELAGDVTSLPGAKVDGPVTTASSIVTSKASAAIPGSVPDAVGANAEPVAVAPLPVVEAPKPPAPATVEPVSAKVDATAQPVVPGPVKEGKPELPPPVEMSPAKPEPETVTSLKSPAPVPASSPATVPFKEPEKKPVIKEEAPVISLAVPGNGAISLPMLSTLMNGAGTNGDSPATSQMSASYQASHDAGLPEFPALPSFDLGVTTNSSASSPPIAVPVPQSPVPPPLAAPEAETVQIPPPVPSVPGPEVLTPVLPATPAVLASEAETAPLPEPKPVEKKEPEVAEKPAEAASVPGGAPVPASPPPAAAPVTKPVEWFVSEVEGGQGKVDNEIGFLYTQRPERWDDLTLLRGVGDALQERLHENGIYTFKQIAAWTPEQSAEAGRRTESQERIQRDRWVQQAGDLHFLKYGERLRG